MSRMRTAFVGMLLGATAITVSADVKPQVDVPGLAKGAEKVVVASVQQVSSRFDTNEYGDNLIVTDAVLRVDETLKGAHVAAASVTVEGGTVGNLTLDVSDMPRLKAGDRAVMFLRLNAAGSNVPHGRGVGIMKLDGSNRVENSNVTLDEIKQLVRGDR
jgi:hypothetical protein